MYWKHLLTYSSFGSCPTSEMFNMLAIISSNIKSTPYSKCWTWFWFCRLYILKGASHYGRRSKGHQFPPIRLLATKSSPSRTFTLRPKSKDRHNLKCLLFEGILKATNSWRKFRSNGNGNPNYGQEDVGFFQEKINHWSRPLVWRGCFGQWIK